MRFGRGFAKTPQFRVHALEHLFLSALAATERKIHCFEKQRWTHPHSAARMCTGRRAAMTVDCSLDCAHAHVFELTRAVFW